jgi:hypothetical protein
MSRRAVGPLITPRECPVRPRSLSCSTRLLPVLQLPMSTFRPAAGFESDQVGTVHWLMTRRLPTVTRKSTYGCDDRMGLSCRSRVTGANEELWGLAPDKE